MNTVTTSFNRIARQTTEMFQQKNDRNVSAKKNSSTPVGNTALGQRNNNAPSLATHGILNTVGANRDSWDSERAFLPWLVFRDTSTDLRSDELYNLNFAINLNHFCACMRI